MTRTHNGHCDHAAVVPWKECACICAGTEHPKGGSVVIPRDRKKRGDYLTALDGVKSPEGLLMQKAFQLATLIVPSAAVQRELAEAVCDALETRYFEGRPRGELEPAEIRARQQTARRLVELADSLGGSEPSNPVLESAIFGGEPSRELLLFYAVLQCGYYGEFSSENELKSLVEPVLRELLPRLATAYAAGRTVITASDVIECLEPSETLSALQQEIVHLIESDITPKRAAVIAGQHDPGHILCTIFALMAEALDEEGVIATATSDVIKVAVDQLAPKGWPQFIKRLVSNVIEKFVLGILAQVVGPGISVPAARAIARLAAIVFCPAIEEHEDVRICLDKLTSQQVSMRIRPELASEISEVLFGEPAADVI